MEAVYYLLPLSLILAIVALIGYFWALRRGQFDDLDTPPLRVLFDDEPDEGTSQPPSNTDKM